MTSNSSAVDIMFIIDILINFRTTYVCENDEVISQVSEANQVEMPASFVPSIPWLAELLGGCLLQARKLPAY